MCAKNAFQNVYSMTIVNEDRTDGKALVTVKCEVQHEMDKHLVRGAMFFSSRLSWSISPWPDKLQYLRRWR